MMSSKIQNYLLSAASSIVLDKIEEEVKSSDGHYALLADECKDTSKRNFLLCLLCYTRKDYVIEQLISIDHLKKLISAKIIELGSKLGIE